MRWRHRTVWPDRLVFLPGFGRADPPALVVQVSGPPDFQLRNVVLTAGEVRRARESGDGCAFIFLTSVLFVIAILMASFPRLVFSDHFSTAAALAVLFLPICCLVLRRWAHDRAIMAAAERARLTPGRAVDAAVVRALGGG